jgi:hypothetical protein
MIVRASSSVALSVAVLALFADSEALPAAAVALVAALEALVAALEALVAALEALLAALEALPAAAVALALEPSFIVSNCVCMELVGSTNANVSAVISFNSSHSIVTSPSRRLDVIIDIVMLHYKEKM